MLTGSPGEIQPRAEMGGQYLKWIYGSVGHILVPFNDPEAKKSFSASTASETASFIFYTIEMTPLEMALMRLQSPQSYSRLLDL